MRACPVSRCDESRWIALMVNGQQWQTADKERWFNGSFSEHSRKREIIWVQKQETQGPSVSRGGCGSYVSWPGWAGGWVGVRELSVRDLGRRDD